MNRVRLVKMADLMHRVQARIDAGELQPRQFDMRGWQMELNCGTAACAVGFACLDPWFNEQGLAFNARGVTPQYGDLLHWAAVTAFFDIDMYDANTLFDSGAYRAGRPWEVASRIMHYVNCKQ